MSLSLLILSGILSIGVSLLEVDTRVGTDASDAPTASVFGSGGEVYGNVIPQVTEPHGMTSWTPQTRLTEGKGVSPYYWADEGFMGFRASHWMSGSATQDYGSVTIRPGIEAKAYSHDDEVATPAYYSVRTRDGGFYELTARSHSALMRFGGTRELVFEVNSDENQGYISYDWASGEVTGYNPVHRIYNGWGLPAGFSGHFICQVRERPISARIEAGKRVILTFPENSVFLVRTGMSFTSLEAARRNLQAEIPDWDFEKVRSSLESIWMERFSRISVQSDDKTQVRAFYSALWRTSLLPRIVSDVDGGYMRIGGAGYGVMASGRPYYDDFSLWDTFRAQHPLLNIMDRAASSDMLSSLVQKYEDGGWMPIFPCWGSYTSAMIGDHVASVMADAVLKGITGFDVEKAYEGLRKNALESPSQAEYEDGKGRRALSSYLSLGYIPLEDGVPFAFHQKEQVSRTLEYAYDDYCLSVLAASLGKEEDEALFLARAGNYLNVLDKRTGWVQGRHDDGSFLDEDNRLEKTSFITEGTPCHYTWFVPHDVKGLMEAMGGEQVFVQKLDSMFDHQLYWHGNEPCNHVAFLYDYTLRPQRTQKAVRDILQSEYRLTPGGLSGNDDAGQMSAWYVFASLGFYPVCPASTSYQLCCPTFSSASISVGEGKVFEILTHGPKDGYIDRVLLDGVPLKDMTLPSDALLKGGTMEVFLR